jgi:hypothetical protein
MRSCDVFFLEALAYVFTHATTERGAALSVGPYFRVPIEAAPAVLGETVLRALEASRDAIPHPGDLRNITKDLLTFTGHRSWGLFARSVKAAVAVGLDQTDVLVIPYTLGPKDSFLPIDSRSVRCRPDPDSVGQSIWAMCGPTGTDRLV